MPEIKKIDKAGYEHFEREEGLRLSAYPDSKSIPTIGIGMTYYPETGKRVKLTDKPLPSKQEAYRQFGLILDSFEKAVWSVTRDDISQSHFNSLCSLSYNIGIAGFKSSTLLRRINSYASNREVLDAFWMWTKDKELWGRRCREICLYFGVDGSWAIPKQAKAWYYAGLIKRVK